MLDLKHRQKIYALETLVLRAPKALDVIIYGFFHSPISVVNIHKQKLTDGLNCNELKLLELFVNKVKTWVFSVTVPNIY